MMPRRGVSLAEVTVAMAVLAAGLLANVALVARSGAMLRAAAADDEAARLAGMVLDSLAQHGRPVAGSQARGRHFLAWTVTQDSAAVSQVVLAVRYSDGARIRSDTFVVHAAPWPRTIGHVP